MSIEQHSEAAAPVSAQHDVRQELARALELTGPNQVVDYRAQNRRDYDVTGQRLGGALVVDCTVSDGDSLRRRSLEIDDERRPLSEEALTFLGAEAVANQKRGKYIHRVVCRPGANG